ncbi:DNA-binding response regulator, partial [Catellatospora methionotrophica]
MEILLLVTARAGEPSAVLPSIDLLPHTVRTAPRDVRTLVSTPSPDAVLVDAR